MAKGIYTGVGGVARKVKKMYIGVGGVAKKIKKVYVGVNGVARLAWSSSFGFVAAGQGTRFIKAQDGTSWSPVSLGLSSAVTVYDSAFGNDTTVIVGTKSYYTKDGINFTEITALSGITLRGITFGNGRFVAVEYDSAYYSLDGINWTAMTGISGIRPTCVCYDSSLNMFVCAGLQPSSSSSTGTYFKYSEDGMTWKSASNSTSSVTNVNRIVFNGTYFYVSSGNGLYYGEAGTFGSYKAWTKITLSGQSATVYVYETNGEVFVNATKCQKVNTDNTVTDFNDGLTETGFRAIIKVEDTYYLLKRSNPGTVYKRDASASTWTKVYEAPTDPYIYLDTICYGGV